MNGTKIQIPVTGGMVDAYVARPAGNGPWPAVIFYQDGLGWRQTLFDMADRLASSGYYVLVPNMFWRAGDFPPFDPKNAFADPTERARLMKIIGEANDENGMRDTEGFLAFLDAQPAVRDAKHIACTGYCMGGGLAMRAACTFPDRFVAALSFHGGRMVTAPDGPETLAKEARARIYIGVAELDTHHTPEVTKHLEDALTAGHVPHVIETYPGVHHGWTMTDFPVYDQAAAERHWERTTAFLREAFA